MALSNYISMCNALVFLMEPLIEIVIHDIKKNNIIYINGQLSQRKVGDPSLLNKQGLSEIEQITYPKINFDGKLVKSISVILEEQWLLCINCDLSLFSKMQDLSLAILQNNMSIQPKSLFTNDWQENIHVTIHGFIQKHNLSFDNLTHADKKTITKHLFNLGAFNQKNAADYLAKLLHIGRATIFKYLKEWRNQ